MLDAFGKKKNGAEDSENSGLNASGRHSDFNAVYVSTVCGDDYRGTRSEPLAAPGNRACGEPAQPHCNQNLRNPAGLFARNAIGRVNHWLGKWARDLVDSDGNR